MNFKLKKIYTLDVNRTNKQHEQGTDVRVNVAEI